MYYTLKQRPAFRHDSTEGPWVMRQTYTVGTQPDLHTSSAVPVAADVATPHTDRQNQEEGFVQLNVRYISVFIHGSLEDYHLGSQTNLLCCEELGEMR